MQQLGAQPGLFQQIVGGITSLGGIVPGIASAISGGGSSSGSGSNTGTAGGMT
jgi:hypothetical protein